MSMTAVPISIRRVRAPTAARSRNGEPSWRAKGTRSSSPVAVSGSPPPFFLLFPPPPPPPHRQLVATLRAHAPGHAQPDDAHALVHGDDACLHVTEALEDRERLGGDVDRKRVVEGKRGDVGGGRRI